MRLKERGSFLILRIMEQNGIHRFYQKDIHENVEIHIHTHTFQRNDQLLIER